MIINNISKLGSKLGLIALLSTSTAAISATNATANENSVVNYYGTQQQVTRQYQPSQYEVIQPAVRQYQPSTHTRTVNTNTNNPTRIISSSTRTVTGAPIRTVRAPSSATVRTTRTTVNTPIRTSRTANRTSGVRTLENTYQKPVSSYNTNYNTSYTQNAEPNFEQQDNAFYNSNFYGNSEGIKYDENDGKFIVPSNKKEDIKGHHREAVVTDARVKRSVHFSNKLFSKYDNNPFEKQVVQNGLNDNNFYPELEQDFTQAATRKSLKYNNTNTGRVNAKPIAKPSYRTETVTTNTTRTHARKGEVVRRTLSSGRTVDVNTHRVIPTQQRSVQRAVTTQRVIPNQRGTSVSYINNGTAKYNTNYNDSSTYRSASPASVQVDSFVPNMPTNIVNVQQRPKVITPQIPSISNSEIVTPNPTRRVISAPSSPSFNKIQPEIVVSDEDFTAKEIAQNSPKLAKIEQPAAQQATVSDMSKKEVAEAFAETLPKLKFNQKVEPIAKVASKNFMPMHIEETVVKVKPKPVAKPKPTATVKAKPIVKFAPKPAAKVAISKPVEITSMKVATIDNTKTIKKANLVKAKPPVVKAPAVNTTSNGKFLRPVSGEIINAFGNKKDGSFNDGINISSRYGENVQAADGGAVVYSGNQLKGYGNLVILRHDNGYLSAYAHLKDLKLKKGEKVKRGQIIGQVGTSGDVETPQLHFGIRKGRNPVDPQNFI